MDILLACERKLENGISINFNSEGWGPVAGSSGSDKVATFDNMPYNHYDKHSKCNRVADFSAAGNTRNDNRGRKNKYGDDMAANEFAFKANTSEDAQFQLVDTAKAVKKHGMRKTTQQQQQQQQQMRGVQTQQQRAMENKGTGTVAGASGNNWNNNNNNRKPYVSKSKQDVRRLERLPSLIIESDWEVIEEFDLTALNKLSTAVPEVEDLEWCGAISEFDEGYEKTSFRNGKTLRRGDSKIFYCVTTTDDPILEKYANEETGNVYATDAILAALMAAPRSVYAWDIVIHRMNGMIFLDKREDNVSFDHLTVSETATLPPVFLEDDVDPMNLPAKLSLEATMINQNYSQQILKKGTKKEFDPNPFFNEEGVEEDADAEATPKEPADVVYRYRKFTLGKIVLVARCELHGFVNKSVSTSAVATSINIGGGARKAAVSAAVASPTGPTTEQYFSSYAFNEWDSKYSNGIPWKLKLDQQRSAVLATECKNNTCKVARWCAQSLLAGADLMKVGYVSRNNAQNNYDHSIVGTQTFKPKELSSQINLQPNNIWGIIKTIAEKILDQPEDGKFILMKDPMKSSMKLFKVPVSDESDEDSDESEEDSEESEEDSEESEEDSDEE